MTHAPSSSAEDTFPLDALPESLADEVQALAGCTGVPVGVTAFALLTAAAGAVGNSVKIRTPTGMASLCLQTAIVAPVHAEAQRLTSLLLEPLCAYMNDLRRKGDELRREEKPKSPTNATVQMNPATHRLHDELTRSQDAAAAPEIVVNALDSQAIFEALNQCFDGSVFVASIDVPSSTTPAAGSTECLFWLHAHFGATSACATSPTSA